jgi:anti-anti-sigma regulatory factor
LRSPSAARAGWSPASDILSTARSASSYPRTKHLILDLSGLSFMDSMGLGTFEFATVKIGES